MRKLLVIGAGLSGMMAAITAARAGEKVHVIATGMGAQHWAAGAVDVLGYLPGEHKPVQAPFAALSSLATHRPEHPYVLLGEQRLRQGLAAFADLTQMLGAPYYGATELDENMLLPSPAGAARPVFLAPEGQIAGDMSRSEPYVIVGFHALRDFYPMMIAENLRKQGHQARAAFLPIETITARRDFSTVTLAQQLDDEAVVVRFASALKRILKPGERVGLPAILGMKKHRAALAALQQALGAPIFEIPTLPPSVPGMRLFLAMRRYLENDLHARLDPGVTVIDSETEDKHVQWVVSETSARPLKHRAQRFLLATGGILGGGFHSNHSGRVWETIFNLPLSIPQQRSQWFHPEFLGPQPVFLGGMRVQQDFRPVDFDNHLIYENLWAAGGALAGADAIAERSLEGIAIASGIAAAQSMIEA